jgi:phage/plasmid-like protein (TIGR03299 family)
MAHEIDTTTGQAAVFVTRTPPWHGLGTVVTDAVTSADAIRLDWKVNQLPLFARRGEGEGTSDLPVLDRVANVRSDPGAVLGVVSTGYRPFQNASAFEFMDNIVQEKLAIFETAGALKGGKQVWMLARLPKTLRAAGDDTLNPYILLTNAHDGSRALRMIPTTVRVVCQNTLSLALGRAASTEGLTVVHSESLDRRVSEARTKLGIVTRRIDEFELQAQAMARRQMTQEELTVFFTQLVKDRSEQQQRKLLERFAANFEDPTNTLPGVKGSLWAAYNAVSEFSDHQSTVRGGNDTQRASGRLYSAWFGAGAAMKEQAFQAALNLAV